MPQSDSNEGSLMWQYRLGGEFNRIILWKGSRGGAKRPILSLIQNIACNLGTLHFYNCKRKTVDRSFLVFMCDNQSIVRRSIHFSDPQQVEKFSGHWLPRHILLLHNFIIYCITRLFSHRPYPVPAFSGYTRPRRSAFATRRWIHCRAVAVRCCGIGVPFLVFMCDNQSINRKKLNPFFFIFTTS